ncbi:MAG TPA: hypothetical protein VHY48_09050 [Acidobacteriaceae bacterium]|jgi:hypothetical protein|nr:hypothetical protein [Acidobacteriaceae bacterium]
MSDDVNVKDALDRALVRLADSVVVPQVEATPVEDTQKSIDDEKRFLSERHERDMADRDAARDQRKVYAKCVFVLVCAWITAIYALLLLQVFGTRITPAYRPLSEAVLIALVSSTTVNLIGTLIVVLKYIFRVPSR